MARQQSYDERNYENGIYRKKVGDKYEYYYIKDDTTVLKKDLERINKLRIPPAWTEVWVSRDNKSNIQAIGIDEKGRKQYRYHEIHIQEAEKQKFLRLIDFIKNLSKLEEFIRQHKKNPIYSKFRVISTMLMIVKETNMRVGKEQYARENKSYGISSLKKNHMKIVGDVINFRFKGKSKQRLSYTIRSPELKHHLSLLLKLEGDKLFQYIDEETDTIKKITDSDLNEYIQQHMGEQFTIKDFRTYAANQHFISALLNETKKRTPKNEKVIKKNILKAIKTTARNLKHTKSISKKSYILNFAIELYRTNPEYFIDRKYDNHMDVLLDILKLYKKEVLDIN